MRHLKPTESQIYLDGKQQYFIGKSTLVQLGETVVFRCFAGCLVQARNRCCCCGLRNYASDVRPTDALAAGVESPCQTLAPGVVFCTATLGLKYEKI